jgi:pyrroline-5-carboxylate reductase
MRTGFIGAGKMAEALLAGLLERGVCQVGELLVSDVDAGRLDVIRGRYGVDALRDNADVVRRSDAVVLAVKPQDLEGVLSGLKAVVAGKLVISIAAGKQLAFFEERLPGARVVRVMPNLACQVGQGMSVLCGGASAIDADLALVRRMFESCGRVARQEESQFDTVTALSGSGPAFFAYMLDALAGAAVARGMAADTALELALQTMLGTAAVMLERGTLPAEFMAGVASKGGTTAAGLDVLRGSDVSTVLEAVLAAAAERSVALRS